MGLLFIVFCSILRKTHEQTGRKRNILYRGPRGAEHRMAADPTLSTILPASRAAPTTKIENCHARLEQEVVDLFEQFRERLLRYLIHFGLGISDGEEIIQEVFLSLFQHLQRGKSRQDLRAWLFRVTHNQALKRRNRNRRLLDTVAESGIEDSAKDPAPNPEDQLVERESRNRLRAVFNALPEHDRQCLALRAEGLRYREIAEILGMSLGAVSLSLARSLARIDRAARR